MRDDYGKLWFNILDYTGSATRLFADPAFDGDPVRITEEEIDEDGDRRPSSLTTPSRRGADSRQEPEIIEPPTDERRKFYFDGGQVEIAAHLVYELDPNGKQLRVVRYTDYAAETVRTLCPTTRELRKRWADPDSAREIIAALAGARHRLRRTGAKRPSSPTPTRSTCFATSPSTRRFAPGASGRSGSRPSARISSSDFARGAREVLDELLEKYAEHGDAQFVLPDVLKVPPISTHGQVSEIIRLFGGADQLRAAVTELQGHLYAA